jgi:hypothetical protein
MLFDVSFWQKKVHRDQSTPLFIMPFLITSSYPFAHLVFQPFNCQTFLVRVLSASLLDFRLIVNTLSCEIESNQRIRSMHNILIGLNAFCKNQLTCYEFIDQTFHIQEFCVDKRGFALFHFATLLL